MKIGAEGVFYLAMGVYKTHGGPAPAFRQHPLTQGAERTPSACTGRGKKREGCEMGVPRRGGDPDKKVAQMRESGKEQKEAAVAPS